VEQPAVGGQEMRTERLRLTRPMATDSPSVFAILGDPRTVEHDPSDRFEDVGEAPRNQVDGCWAARTAARVS
jgi:hypothetical protein